MTADDLQDLVDEAVARSGVVGAGAAVLHLGEVVEAASGMANVLTGLRARPETLFQVGSTTELHNAALVMTCVERGELDLSVGCTTSSHHARCSVRHRPATTNRSRG